MKLTKAVRKGLAVLTLLLCLLAHARPAYWSWWWVVIAGGMLATVTLGITWQHRNETRRIRTAGDAVVSVIVLAVSLAATVSNEARVFDAAILAGVALACLSLI